MKIKTKININENTVPLNCQRDYSSLKIGIFNGIGIKIICSIRTCRFLIKNIPNYLNICQILVNYLLHFLDNAFSILYIFSKNFRI